MTITARRAGAAVRPHAPDENDLVLEPLEAPAAIASISMLREDLLGMQAALQLLGRDLALSRAADPKGVHQRQKLVQPGILAGCQGDRLIQRLDGLAADRSMPRDPA